MHGRPAGWMTAMERRLAAIRAANERKQRRVDQEPQSVQGDPPTDRHATSAKTYRLGRRMLPDRPPVVWMYEWPQHAIYIWFMSLVLLNGNRYILTTLAVIVYLTLLWNRYQRLPLEADCWSDTKLYLVGEAVTGSDLKLYVCAWKNGGRDPVDPNHRQFWMEGRSGGTTEFVHGIHHIFHRTYILPDWYEVVMRRGKYPVREADRWEYYAWYSEGDVVTGDDNRLYVYVRPETVEGIDPVINRWYWKMKISKHEAKGAIDYAHSIGLLTFDDSTAIDIQEPNSMPTHTESTRYSVLFNGNEIARLTGWKNSDTSWPKLATLTVNNCKHTLSMDPSGDWLHEAN